MGGTKRNKDRERYNNRERKEDRENNTVRKVKELRIQNKDNNKNNKNRARNTVIIDWMRRGRIKNGINGKRE